MGMSGPPTIYIESMYSTLRANLGTSSFSCVTLEAKTILALSSCQQLTSRPTSKKRPAITPSPTDFALPGTKVLVQRFEIIDRASTLDRIERALRDADFYKNRSFLSWAIPGTLESGPPLSSIYEEPIDNWWVEIPWAFEELRKRAQKARLGVEAALKKLQMIEGTPDPEELLGLAEELKDDWEGAVRLPDLFDEEFLLAVRYHKRRYQELDESGLLGAHAAIRRTAVEYIVSDLTSKMPVPKDDVYILKAIYDPETFLGTRYESQIERISALWPNPSSDPSWFGSDIPRIMGLLVGEPGSVQVYIAAGRLGYPGPTEGTSVDVNWSWPDQLRGFAKEMTAKLLESVLAARFGE